MLSVSLALRRRLSAFRVTVHDPDRAATSMKEERTAGSDCPVFLRYLSGAGVVLAGNLSRPKGRPGRRPGCRWHGASGKDGKIAKV